MKDTSWQKVSHWYQKTVGESGSFFHKEVILPRSLALLHLQSSSRLLDLACGQGVLSRALPNIEFYQGFDLSPELIKEADKLNHQPKHHFQVADVTKPLPISFSEFSHGTIILALQNIAEPDKVIHNFSRHLSIGGKLLLILNHPCFRIPRQSSWEIDNKNKIEYRRLNRYLSPLRIPITAHPGRSKSPLTWSFHEPLSYYFKLLKVNHFVVTDLEEWTSPKESQGKAAKMENLARNEFPLFLALLATKSTSSFSVG